MVTAGRGPSPVNFGRATRISLAVTKVFEGLSLPGVPGKVPRPLGNGARLVGTVCPSYASRAPSETRMPLRSTINDDCCACSWTPNIGAPTQEGPSSDGTAP